MASACAPNCSSHPEELGAIGSLTPGLANWANRQPLLRVLAEATIGIHRDKILPEFQSADFFLLDEATARPARRHLASGPLHHLLRRLLQPASRQRRRKSLREKRHRAHLPEAKLLRHARAGIRRRRTSEKTSRLQRRVSAAVRRARKKDRSHQSHVLLHAAKRVRRTRRNRSRQPRSRRHHGPLRVPLRTQERRQVQPRIPIHAQAKSATTCPAT